VEVTASEENGYRFTLSQATVPAGEVIFQFVNHGQDPHNLHVASGEGSEAGAISNTPGGQHEEQKMVLRAGSYTLFCSLPAHEEKGMKATLTVQ
jgi:plastocyanin